MQWMRLEEVVLAYKAADRWDVDVAKLANAGMIQRPSADSADHGRHCRRWLGRWRPLG